MTCSFPGCEEVEPLFSREDSPRYWWCADHITDEGMPALRSGPAGECVRCGGSAITWLGDDCVHSRCLRHRVGEQSSDVPVTGAYARRRR